MRENLEYIQEHAPIKFGFVIVVNDYLISQAPEFEGKISEEDNLQKYDLIIGNPPYLRVMRIIQRQWPCYSRSWSTKSVFLVYCNVFV